jgi:hypothetical protein
VINVQMLRGSTAQVAAYTGPPGELVIDFTLWLVYLQDGATAGGHLVGSIASFPITAAQGGTGLTTLTAHAVLIGNGTGTLNFAPEVSAGYVLTDNGSGTDPTFQAPIQSSDTIDDAVAAAGTTQGTATVLTAQVNVITSGTAGQGVNLSAFTDHIYVFNTTANDLLVWPDTGDSINNLAANAAFTLFAGSNAVFKGVASLNNWYSVP